MQFLTNVKKKKRKHGTVVNHCSNGWHTKLQQESISNPWRSSKWPSMVQLSQTVNEWSHGGGTVFSQTPLKVHKIHKILKITQSRAPAAVYIMMFCHTYGLQQCSKHSDEEVQRKSK